MISKGYARLCNSADHLVICNPQGTVRCPKREQKIMLTKHRLNVIPIVQWIREM